MDASPLFDPQYLPVVLATLIGFSALAALLLVPVYRFLEREEEVADRWTVDELKAQRRRKEAGRGDESAAAAGPDPASDADGAPSPPTDSADAAPPEPAKDE
jgi:hypothetical protein